MPHEWYNSVSISCLSISIVVVVALPAARIWNSHSFDLRHCPFCVRECVRACVRARMRARVRVCVCVCVCVVVWQDVPERWLSSFFQIIYLLF